MEAKGVEKAMSQNSGYFRPPSDGLENSMTDAQRQAEQRRRAEAFVPSEEFPLPHRVLDHGYSEMAEQLQVYKILTADLMRCIGITKHVVPRSRQTVPPTKYDMDEQDGLVLTVEGGS